MPVKDENRTRPLALAILGTVSFVFGIIWIIIGPRNTRVIALGLIFVGFGLASLSKLVVKIAPQADSANEIPTKPADARTANVLVLLPGLSSRWRRIGMIVGVIVAFLLWVPMMAWIVWFQYSSRPKPSTVGYAELNTESYEISFDLPPNWRIDYYSRRAPSFYEGRITDGAGRPRLRVYGIFRGGGLDEYARQETDLYTKWRIPLEWAEFRDTPRSRWWVFAIRSGYDDQFFGGQPLLVVKYASKRGVLLEFTMPAVEAAELEPLVWECVQTAELRFSP